MDEKISVLDLGYVGLIDVWGSDQRIVESARMSTAKGFLGWGERHDQKCPATQPKQDGSAFGGECNCTPKPGDEKLLRYLWENKHQTPFEMAGVTIEVKAPIFIFREWHRHRVPFGYNEMSSRYVPLPDENYVPSMDRVLNGGQSKTNKQASGTPVAEQDALEWLAELAAAYELSQKVYESGLRRGIAKELARLPVPVARYSVMRATANLRGWLAFLALRDHAAAQWEMQKYARTVSTILKELFPRTMEIFLGGKT